ncbi:MAG TPA: histidinol phosphate phosphatase domain-containing protein [bacterium]|nr:histidinol phosphate phosphatase domain-containing protein [bacterium]
MIDLHLHTFFSDGELLPSELVRRAQVRGYTALALTDHVDFSNVRQVVPAAVEASRHLSETASVKVIPGCEITHVAPVEIPELAVLARKLGALLVVVHGETLVEPVLPGTNRAALKSEIDLLAHPGFLSEEDARLAAERGIAVELSTRKGHCLGNGLTVVRWYQFHFPLVLNTDTHAAEDLVDDEFARRVLLSSGVKENDVQEVLKNSQRLVEKTLARTKKYG